jgi:hypothetical protein
MVASMRTLSPMACLGHAPGRVRAHDRTMKPRTHRSVLVVVLVVVVASLIGSVGTATAAGLTKHTVKKIATKVVKKQARTITVANSTQLGGQPPSAYQSPTYVFSATIIDPIHDAQVPVQLPSGRYLIGYSVLMGGAATVDVDCDLEYGSTAFAETKTHTTTTPTLSGFGYVDTGSGAPLKLHCSSTALWGTGTAQPLQIVATRVDLAQAVTATPITS